VNAAVQRLRAEIASDRRAFEARLDELAAIDLSAPSPAPSTLAHAAVVLHHAFGAVEAALARASRALEGTLPEGADSHRALLEAMALEVESVRPAVLSAESLGLLRRLLGFRHFFRHAYAVSFDAERIEALRRDALALRAPLARDLDGFDRFLEALARG
jgi:hypothetical protein